jgi:hypothetical protein
MQTMTQWKTHEMKSSYVGFIAQQVLGIIGLQIEACKVFNIVGIHTNL